MLKAGGQWSTYVITVKDTHLRIVLNGVETATGYDSQLASGPVALQFGNRGKEPGARHQVAQGRDPAAPVSAVKTPEMGFVIKVVD